MGKTVLLANKHGVAIGAHPGYPDREGFGRNPVKMSEQELSTIIKFQINALKTIAESAGMKLQHVKCHGALYNTAANDYNMSMVIAGCIKEIDRSIILVGLSGSELIRAGLEAGLKVASEVFADSGYNEDGSLVSRVHPDAILRDESVVIERAIRMIKEKSVVSITGKTIPVSPDTICIHGDNPMSLEFAKGLKRALTEAGISIRSISNR